MNDFVNSERERTAKRLSTLTETDLAYLEALSNYIKHVQNPYSSSVEVVNAGVDLIEMKRKVNSCF